MSWLCICLLTASVLVQVQGFGTCCGYPVKGYNTSGGTPINPASGGNGTTPSGWVFTVCLNNYCPILNTYAPGYGISTWFQRLWEVSLFADSSHRGESAF